MRTSGEQYPNPLGQGDRTCVHPNIESGCTSLNFPSVVPYSKVFGSVIAYQYGYLNAYRLYYESNRRLTLEDQFVDGVVLTHGSPRQHVWTFIAARDELVTHSASGCPCLRPVFALPPPPYIGNDYFCDSGSRQYFEGFRFYGDDPLWDGAGCESIRGFSNTCCTSNTPPWFYKDFPHPTTNSLECRDLVNNDLAIESFEIYVQ